MNDRQPQRSPFWRFSLQVLRHARRGRRLHRVAGQAGVDVNLLLFLLWNADAAAALSAPTTCRSSSTRSRPGATSPSFRSATSAARSKAPTAGRCRPKQEALPHPDQGGRARGRAAAAGGALRAWRSPAALGKPAAPSGRRRAATSAPIRASSARVSRRRPLVTVLSTACERSIPTGIARRTWHKAWHDTAP